MDFTTFHLIYVNDLVIKIKSLGIGIDIGGEMLYADDLVLVSATEDDLQIYCYIEDLTLVVISYEIYETSLRRVS